MLRDEQILLILSRCTELKQVILYDHKLTPDGMMALAQMKNLRHIELIHCTSYNYDSNSLMEMAFDDLMTSTVGTMTSLTRFKVVGYKYQWLHNFFRCICNWKYLRVLSLRWVQYSSEVFERMIPGVMDLQSLDLEGAAVNSSIVLLVGKYLKKLKSLDLKHGCFTNESFDALSYHPSLEYFSVMDSPPTHGTPTELSWLQAVYDMMVTLPKVKQVKLAGYQLPLLYKRKKFPIIEGAEIEVINTQYGYDGFCRSEEIRDQQNWWCDCIIEETQIVPHAL